MRDSLRIFQTQPGFAAAAVLALGLCLAANNGLFSVVNAMLLRPLSFTHSEQLVDISIPERRVDLKELEGAVSIESAGAFTPVGFAVGSAGSVRNVFGVRATPDLIPLLALQPAQGRALTRDDAGRNIIMIGHEYWRMLGAQPDIAGSTLIVNGEPCIIAGVLPADFYLSVRDVALVLPDLRTAERTIARLHPGITAAQAQSDIAQHMRGGHVQVTALASAFRSSDSAPMVMLLATAGFVLLITCANLANLQLVRGLARRREFAIRTAMGASHGRLLQQLVVESGVLAVAGAAVGVVLTRALHDVILTMLPLNITRRMLGADALPLDWRVLFFTASVASATILLFGVLPALSSLRFDLLTGLGDAVRGSGGSRQTFGQALVSIEIALALMLLAGAGLTFKSLAQLEGQYLGFRPQGVLRGMTDFSGARYPRPEQKVALFTEVERRVAALPGVASVGIVAPQVFPFGGPRGRGARFEIFGKPDVEARAQVYTANPAYLDAIRLPLLRGRWFTESDNASSPPVAVLSETVAHEYWTGDECIGRKVRLNPGGAESVWATIVGVVGDVKNPVALTWQPTAYTPFAQTPYGGATLMVRASVSDPLSLAPAIRRELQAIDPTASEMRIAARLDDAVHDYRSGQRFTTRLLAVFAAIGLALAANGVYGVIRYWVASRTGEIGIRMALGATPWDVLRLLFGRVAIAVGVGVVAGYAGTWALQRLIAAQLIGVKVGDPVVLGSVAGVIVAAAFLAAWKPAFRASRIDPAVALRAE